MKKEVENGITIITLCLQQIPKKHLQQFASRTLMENRNYLVSYSNEITFFHFHLRAYSSRIVRPMRMVFDAVCFASIFFFVGEYNFNDLFCCRAQLAHHHIATRRTHFHNRIGFGFFFNGSPEKIKTNNNPIGYRIKKISWTS